MSSSGGLVPDGNYSLQFKLYDGAVSGSNEWTETQGSVTVKNGYLSVQLGSVTPFGSSIDWSQERWLTMNVNADGEMNPRIKLTANPYSFRSGQADSLTNGSGTLTADNLVQLAPSSVQAVNTALAALRINQTGSGLLAQLQGNGSDVFTIAKTGDVISAGSASFQGPSLEIGAVAQSGGLVLNDGSSNTGTLETAALSANRTYTLPNQSGEICLVTTCSGGSGGLSFIQDGNSYGETAVLGTNDNFALNFETNGTTQLVLDTIGNLDILNGDLRTAGTLRLTNAGVLQNVTGNNSNGVSFDANTITSGLLPVARGGTGAGLFTTNGVIYGNNNGTLQVTAAGTGGQVLLANGSGVPIFTTINGDAALAADGTLTIGANSVALGADTVGNYVQNLGTLAGLSTTGNSGEGSTPTLSVIYGSGANTSVQGSTTLICPSGTGNLSGTGNTITLGTGGTCNALDTKAAVSFATSVTTPIITSLAGLTISSGGSGDISLNSGSNKITIDGSDTSLERIGSGTFTLNLSDGATTTLTLNNSGTGAASLNLQDGGLQIAGTTVLSNGRALQNLTGISSTGSIVLNSFSGAAGILQVDTSGNVSIATAGTGYEVPLTFNNGLVRSGNTVKLGGALTANTDIPLSNFNFTFSGSGNVGIGTTAPDSKLHVVGGGVCIENIDSNCAASSGTLSVGSGLTLLGGPLNLTANSGSIGLTGFGTTSITSTVTSGNVNTFTNSVLAPVASGAASLMNLVFTNAATNTSGVSGVNGLNIIGTNNAAGNLGIHATIGVNIQPLTGTPGAGTQVNYGMYIGNQGLSGSEVAYGLYVAPQSGSGVNYAAIFEGGNVGIGTSSPLSLFSVGSSSQFQVNGSGTITAATSTNTINGLIINSGSLSGVTGITFTSGSLNMANGGIINTGSIAGATTITASGNINTTAGNIQTNTVTRLTNAGALQNITGNNSNGVSFDANTITSGLLPVLHGGTGAGSFTTNGVIFGNNTGTLQVTAAGTGGQVLLANGSGVPAFTTLSGDVTVDSSGLTTIGANAVALGTHTTGNYIANITVQAGGGLVVSGTGSETATASLTIRRDCANNQIVKWSTSGSGVWNCANDNSGLSDSRVKTNTTTINSNVLDKLKSVRLVEFDFNCSSPAFTNLHCNIDHQAGVIAQELATVFPELVFTDANGYYNVRYDILGVYNMRALSQLSSIISANGDAALGNIRTGGTLRLSSSGTLQNITGLNSVGNLSSSGGAVSLNANSNFATNLNTGNSTGAVTIGGGSAPLVINSTNFDVSAAGALSGITTISATGNINTSGAFSVDGTAGQTINCGNQNVRGGFSGGIATGVTCGGLSDASLKENIVSLDTSILEKIGGINTVNFDFKCNDPEYTKLKLDCDRQTGVVAQELAQIFPELVYQGEDGYYRVKYDALNIYTLKATSEIAKKIDNIEQPGEVKEVKTGGTVRLTESGQLENITGLKMVSGGASVIGGLDNNNGGITETGAINGATTIQAESLKLSSGSSSNMLELKKDDKNVFTVFNNGALELKLSADIAFIVKDGNSKDYFSVNTKGGLVRVGSGQSDNTAVLLVLDNIHMDGDPQGINGAQYYNTVMERFRCHQNNRWHNCVATGNAEYIISSSRFSWSPPENEKEIPGSPRIWVDLTSTNNFRLNIQMNSPGAAGTECQVQFATSETGGWFSLDSENTFLPIDRSGALKTDWMNIKAQAYQEVILRAVCRGGNSGSDAQTLAEFNSIRLQIR